MKKKNICFFIRLSFYIVFIAFFVCIPLTSVGKSFCFYYNTLGIICPTCGFTRGFTSLMHGYIEAAYKYNPFLIMFAVPVTFLTIIQDIVVSVKRIITRKNKLSFIEFLLKPSIYFGE